MTVPARRPWWKRKRWATAVGALLGLWIGVALGVAVNMLAVESYFANRGPTPIGRGAAEVLVFAATVNPLAIWGGLVGYALGRRRWDSPPSE